VPGLRLGDSVFRGWFCRLICSARLPLGFFVWADGVLLIDHLGIAAHIELSLDGDPSIGGTGFSFHGAFIFELNTTDQYIAQIGGVDVNLAAGPYIRLSVTDDGSDSAYMQLSLGSSLNCFRLEGGLTIEANSSGLQVAADGSLKAIIGGITLFSVDAEGELLINQYGLAAKISLDASAGISGTGFMFGSIIISVGSGGFEFIIPDTDPLTLKVGTIISAELFGYIKPTGFSFTATADFHAEDGPAYLDATATIRLSNSEFYFYIEGSAGLRIAGVNIGVSASGTVQISGTQLLLSVRGCVTVVVKICATVTFKIGTISPPGAAQVTPEPVLATQLSNGTLRLNIGSFAFVRGAGYSDIEDETFYVRHDGGTASGETVIVSAFGFSQTYSNIKSILVSDAASGNDFVQVGEALAKIRSMVMKATT